MTKVVEVVVMVVLVLLAGTMIPTPLGGEKDDKEREGEREI